MAAVTDTNHVWDSWGYLLRPAKSAEVSICGSRQFQLSL